MRTRAAILSMLALGFVLSTTGAGLAVGGLSDENQASQAQYPPPASEHQYPPPATTPPTTPPATPPTTPTTPESVPPTTPPATPETPSGGGALPEQEENTPPKPESTPTDTVLPEAQAPAADTDVQPARQFEANTGSSLPFTGFAALPILLVGIALLSGGLVMRRSTRTD